MPYAQSFSRVLPGGGQLWAKWIRFIDNQGVYGLCLFVKGFFMGVESSVDHNEGSAIIQPTERAKKHVCGLCGFELPTEHGRGRRRRYCSELCRHTMKVLMTRAGRRKFQNGMKPICRVCGCVLDPPGSSGGRPQKYCAEHRRRRLRRYETEKKRRKNILEKKNAYENEKKGKRI